MAGTVAAGAVAAGIAVAPGSGTAGFVPSGATPRQDAEQITAAFVRAWRDGDLARAASYTNHPKAAAAALAAYRDGLHLQKLSGTPVGAAQLTDATQIPQVRVQVAVRATVAAPSAAGAVSGDWSYRTALLAYQKSGSPAWSIAWSPGDLAPDLTAGSSLQAVPVTAKAGTVTDASGRSLTSYHDAGLTKIAGLLKAAPPAGLARPGLDVAVAGRTRAPGAEAAVVTPASVPAVTTTISAAAERAARGAVAQHPQSSLVAIQPSTGHILAIANNDGFNDFALTAQVAPGSAGKIISSAALLAGGVLTAGTPVSCPAVYTVQGVSFHNDQGESEPATTPLSQDFARSCNNAFSQWWRAESGGRLAAAARRYFGLGEPWDIGIGQGATYYEQPADARGAQLAQNMFGEGAITASPLAMASVAATVETGHFRQPVLVPGTKQLPATPLPASTDAQLTQMMRDVVTSGTAAGLGFGPDVYAKTGTSDVDGQEQPDSWFVAFDPARDVAVADLVIDAGYGAQYAAPEVRRFLRGLQSS